ncbi:MAG: hypothetical protein H6Q17_2712 [Bacteroidetes bacterium]|nr:hypothetical protein [Bacteroidota bacterium]
MKRIKVLLSFIKLAVASKIAFYRNVVTKMTGNAAIPTTDVPLTEATAVTDGLEKAQIAAQDGSHTAIALLHEAEAKADAVFRILAANVDRVADGDEAIILSTGFEPSSQPEAHQKAALTAVDGSHSGSVKLVAKAIRNAGAYLWQSAKDTLPATEEGWKDMDKSTSASIEKDGFIAGCRYYFRVAMVTPSGTTDYTEPVSKIVT